MKRRIGKTPNDDFLLLWGRKNGTKTFINFEKLGLRPNNLKSPMVHKSGHVGNDGTFNAPHEIITACYSLFLPVGK